MASKLFSFVLFLVAAAGLLTGGDGAEPSNSSAPFDRKLFPADFIFGAATAAYQVEGAAAIDGKGPSIWDTFVKKHPEKIVDHSTGDVAEDFYHRYKDDIKLMKEIGLDSFRLSLSWSRLLPKGKASEVNPDGLKFYNSLIDELLANGIKPFVTLYHWDLPQALEDEYGGFLSPKVVNDFGDYADFCFRSFGDRVKHWVTLNEPLTSSVFGYNSGAMAPGRCSNYVGKCEAGNSATEPYLAAHNFLLSHATAVKLYKQKYQATQKGQIGITLVTHFFTPLTESVADQEAAKRMLDFMFGWFAHAVTYGDYPPTMRALVKERLPQFTKDQQEMLTGSYDFLGVNYYSTHYAANSLAQNNVNQSWWEDSHCSLTTEKNGVSIGKVTGVSMFPMYPKGIRSLMLHIKEAYKNPPIYITENGVSTRTNPTSTLENELKDDIRIEFHQSHLSNVLEAMKEGANVKAYYLWTFLDDFEWDGGYSIRFGIVFVDFKNDLTRHLKNSASWLKKFLLH